MSVRRRVMPMLHPVDHAAGAEEQERLEERVGQQVEDGGQVGADATLRT